MTDPTTRLREADLLDRHVLELRTHLATMRQISPRMAGTVMNEHAAHVQAIGERLTSLRARLTVPDAALPTLIGMRADEYRVIQDEARTAAAEVDHFRQADEDTIRERMPGHLDRLEQLAGQMEQMAAGLRR